MVLPRLTYSVTQEVQDYLLLYTHKGVHYEIHLLDSPEFDDGTIVDSINLDKIATYLNFNYELKKRLAGVLYLHDVTKGKVGGVAQRNLRMLERMIGVKNFGYCTFVTTKWGSNRSDEKVREKALTDGKFFGQMLQDDEDTRMKRFDPKNKDTALGIIRPYLNKAFTT